MTRILATLALGASFTLLTVPSVALAGRGGGMGGNMQRGGGPGGGGGARGGGGFSGEGRGAGGGMNHSPAFSPPRSTMNGPSGGSRNPRSDDGGAGGRSFDSSNPNANRSSADGRNPYASNTDTGSRNFNSTNPNSSAAAAGASAAHRNQNPYSNAGAAAAGAGVANRNQSPYSNAGAAAAGAGVANRNQSPYSNAGAAAAGAGVANRNQSPYSNAGAAAAGAGVANRNQSPYSNADAAALGAGVANRNQYDSYHPGMSNGYWNGNYGASAVSGYGGVGAWGMGSPAYGYGYSSYTNPYSAGSTTVGGTGQPVNPAPAASAPSYDYSQPLNTATDPPPPAVADQASSAIAQARAAFQSGDYDTALQLTQQALGQLPNDATLHEFLGLVFFARGNYEQAAAPIYSVLSIGPGWDWTTLISNYTDADIYTQQLRGLETYVQRQPQIGRRSVRPGLPLHHARTR